MATNVNDAHRQKFNNYLTTLDKAKAEQKQVVVVGRVETLGTTYEEVLANLRLLSEAGLALRVDPSAGQDGIQTV